MEHSSRSVLRVTCYVFRSKPPYKRANLNVYEVCRVFSLLAVECFLYIGKQRAMCKFTQIG